MKKQTKKESKAYSCKIFPNPADQIINIRLNIPEKANFDIKLLTVDGRRVDNIYNGQLKAGKSVIDWNASTCQETEEIESGLYLISVEASDYSFKKSTSTQLITTKSSGGRLPQGCN